MTIRPVLLARVYFLLRFLRWNSMTQSSGCPRRRLCVGVERLGHPAKLATKAHNDCQSLHRLAGINHQGKRPALSRQHHNPPRSYSSRIRSHLHYETDPVRVHSHHFQCCNMDASILQRRTHVCMLPSQSGLCKSVRNLPWIASCDPNSFFPRCYDLGDKDDVYVYVPCYVPMSMSM